MRKLKIDRMIGIIVRVAAGRKNYGTGGGISIMDGYRMDRTILTSKDMQRILAGLRSLDSAEDGIDLQGVMLCIL